MTSGANRPSLMTGARLRPDLRVISRLGAGGMGVVYKALDESLDREVAVKVIHPELVRDADTAERFLGEARAMARVRHPHVVQIFSFGTHLDQPFLVMELMEGETLEERLAKRNHDALAVDEALGVLDAVAQGVDAIHAAGVVHGDLKPANILFATSFRVAVSDFGLATQGSRGSDAGLGTAAYLAPERVTALDEDIPGGGLSPAADRYALGCIAFELLTGDVPFDAPDIERILIQHLYKDPPSLGARRPELGTRFDGAVLPFLAKDPAARPADGRALREALAEARRALPAARRSARVLHVDDDRDFRDFVAAVITAELPEIELEQARDGLEALARYEGAPFDLVLFDLRMPNMNGFELAAVLLGDPRHPPLIAITGEGGAADWRVLSGLGVDGFVLKPVEPLALVAAIRRYLGHPPRRR